MELTKAQTIVLRAFRQVGDVDDSILADRVHHLADVASSGVRTRRHELYNMGLVRVVGTKKLRSGRTAAVYGLTYNGRRSADVAERRAAKGPAA